MKLSLSQLLVEETKDLRKTTSSDADLDIRLQVPLQAQSNVTAISAGLNFCLALRCGRFVLYYTSDDPSAILMIRDDGVVVSIGGPAGLVPPLLRKAGMFKEKASCSHF